MARTIKSPLSGRPRYTVDQSGAPVPETNKDTVTIGRQPDEKADDKPAAKPASKG